MEKKEQKKKWKNLFKIKGQEEAHSIDLDGL